MMEKWPSSVCPSFFILLFVFQILHPSSHYFYLFSATLTSYCIFRIFIHLAWASIMLTVHCVESLRDPGQGSATSESFRARFHGKENPRSRKCFLTPKVKITLYILLKWMEKLNLSYPCEQRLHVVGFWHEFGKYIWKKEHYFTEQWKLIVCKISTLILMSPI